MNKRGFTLIELLVVVAILGILATLIITNLSKARSEAKEVAIISEIQGLKTSVEVETGANGNYTTVCDLFNAGQKFAMVRESIESKGGIWTSCTSDANSYAVVVEFDSSFISSNIFETKIAYAQRSAPTPVETIPAADHAESPILGAVKATVAGVHSAEQLLISAEGLKVLKSQVKTNGGNYIHPRYYCMGAVPETQKGSTFREGFLYQAPTSGCGSNIPDASVYDYYVGINQASDGGIDELDSDPSRAFMANFNRCLLAESELEQGVTNGWITTDQSVEYQFRCSDKTGGDFLFAETRKK